MTFHIEKIAAEMVALLGTGRQTTAFSERQAGALTLAQAYQVGNAARRLRIARGERPVGRKIGFTNGKVRAEFGVAAPIWSTMYDTTVGTFAALGERMSLSGFPEPRIEPEISLHLVRAPQHGMNEDELFSCIGSVALGFEIVQSLYPGWKFAASDTIAGFGLHARLRIGEPLPIAPCGPITAQTLSHFDVELYRNGTLTYQGHGTDVFDGPLQVLKYLVDVLAEDPESPPLAAGETLTTGTLTPAPLCFAGETWEARLEGLPLKPIRLTLE
jgi:2-oxo-3-hexenedioate decarboxylase